MSTKASKKGFTLAEVLVTLVVIGIVAALCIPALLQNTNQAELRTAFKKSLSVLNQALVISVAQNATDANSCCGATSTTDLANFFANKLNVISGYGNASFFTADGMQYTVVKKSQACPATEDPDPSTASCVVLVDVNGLKGPNQDSSGLGSSNIYKDRYYLDVHQNSVVPASNTTNDAAVQALQN